MYLWRAFLPPSKESGFPARNRDEDIAGENAWSVALSQGESKFASKYQPTGNLKHQSIKVYNHLISAINQFVKEIHPPYFVAVSAQERQGQLYGKLIERLLKHYNYVQIFNDPWADRPFEDYVFVFHRKANIITPPAPA